MSSLPSGEFDFFVRASSAQWGLISMRLRGARRGGSRLKFLKEPGMYVDLHLYGRPGQEICQMLTGTILESFDGVREDYPDFRRALELLRFAEIFMTPFDPQAEEKTCLMMESLAAMSLHPANARAIAASFKLKMLDLSGWRFSASQAVRLMDTPISNVCKGLEEGMTDIMESPILEKLDHALDNYADHLASV